jgi:hypothetical protein
MYKMFMAISAVAFATVATAQTTGAAHTAVVAAVHQFVEGFNKGDMKIMAASCAEQTSILDEFPPHEWHGAGACAKWASDYDADAKKNGITDGVVTLSTPSHSGCHGGPGVRGGSCELQFQVKREAGWRGWVYYYAGAAEESGGMEDYGMGLGETLGPQGASASRTASRFLLITAK